MLIKSRKTIIIRINILAHLLGVYETLKTSDFGTIHKAHLKISEVHLEFSTRQPSLEIYPSQHLNLLRSSPPRRS